MGQFKQIYEQIQYPVKSSIQSLEITVIKDSRNLKMGRVSLELRRYKLRKWKTWNGSWNFIAELREEKTYRMSGIHRRRAKASE